MRWGRLSSIFGGQLLTKLQVQVFFCGQAVPSNCSPLTFQQWFQHYPCLRHGHWLAILTFFVPRGTTWFWRCQLCFWYYCYKSGNGHKVRAKLEYLFFYEQLLPSPLAQQMHWDEVNKDRDWLNYSPLCQPCASYTENLVQQSTSSLRKFKLLLKYFK